MLDHTGQQIVILKTICWWQKFGGDYHWINNDYTDFIRRGKEQYRVEVSNRIPALEGLAAEVANNSVWEIIRENIKISAKQPWCDEALVRISRSKETT
jgi:hypothetical protein